jgi:RHS repeat-associated protein
MITAFPRFVRAWLPALAALAVVSALPARATAQQCSPQPCGLTGFTPPTVTVSPATGTYPSGQVNVRIDFSDDSVLNHGSMYVSFGTQEVTSQFHYVMINPWTSYATATLPVPPGSTLLSAEICDASSAGACGYVQATYTGPPPSVRVTPEVATLSVAANTPAATRYRVANTGLFQTTYTLTSSCPGGWGCTPSSPTMVLAAGDSVFVDVNFTAPTSGSGGVQLSAASGSVSSVGGTAVSASSPADPGFPGDDRSLQRTQRDACITVAMGPASASECGDLRVVHALPDTRILNKSRSPVLFYNSGHGRPIPIVAEHLAGPASGVPDSIRAVLLVDGVQVAAVRFQGWGSGTVRRIAVPFQAHAHATGVYTYTLQVTAEWLNGTQQALTTRTGRMGVVNRSASPFGAGWWIAGLEQLVTVAGDTAKLWIGGDGSMRIYRGNAGGPWVADAYDRPDTLYNTTSAELGTVTVRTLPGRSEVWFDALGRHVRTLNRMQQYTAFRWDGSYLVRINLPYAGAQGDTTRYSFEYGNNPTATVRNLSRVTAPGARDTWFTTDAGARVTKILDPDSSFVTFGYAGTSKWMSRRTDRRSVAETFDYQRNRFFSSSRPASPTENILIRVTSVVTQGITRSVSLDSVRHIFDGPRPGAEVCDCTWWHTDRYGAPTDVRDAFHRLAYLTRGDARWPGLVTTTVAPNGFTSTAAYDSLGNVSSRTAVNPYGDGRNSTTTYRWDPYWDAPIRMVSPEGEIALTGYDGYGRRAWEQAGPSTARLVTYGYNPLTHASAPGLPASVTVPGGATETFEYDARGNLSATQTPLGFRTEVLSDAVGRVLRTRQPAYADGALAGWRSDSTTHDRAGRPLRTVTSGPGTGLADAQQRVVENRYDASGNLTAMSRWSVPDTAKIGVITTRWRYDLAGRQIAAYAPDATPLDSLDNPRDSLVYDLASNVVAVHSRRLADSVGVRPSEQLGPVTMTYDALNRLLKRRVPAVLYQPRDQGISLRGFIEMHEGLGTNVPYPWYPSGPGGEYLIAADSATFAYDAGGNLVRADNEDARVRRSYYPGGALRADTLVVRTEATIAGGGDWTSHVYALEHTYDRNGRRVDLKHPAGLAPLSATGQPMDHSRWSYDRETGALASVTDVLGSQISFTFNLRGELERITRPGGVVQSYRYDGDGRMLTDSVRGILQGLPAVMRAANFQYDPASKLVWTRNGTAPYDTLFAQYAGIGHVVSGFSSSKAMTILGHRAASNSRDRILLDALGNRVTTLTQTAYRTAGLLDSASVPGSFRYHAGSGRMRMAGNPVQSDTFHYDAAGNEVFTTQSSSPLDGSAPLRDRASFYGADNALRAAELRVVHDPAQGGPAPYSRAFEEYRYDALGRRVWVRTRQRCKLSGNGYHACQLGKTRRTVWDGDRELYEIQMPDQYAENDSATVQQALIPGGALPVDPNPFWGRVAYTYGGAVDQPLSLVRMGYVDMRDSADYIQSTAWKPSPVSIFPVWNERGQPVFGTFSTGGTRWCSGSRCLRLAWPAGWFAYERPRFESGNWHGTLLEDKQDATGTHYRRARYYDPNTGRFTQEDPIGLAGGMNLYGFAGGDPVNFSDPFGLCPYHGRKRTTDLSDCPTRTREQRLILEAFRILEGDEEGRRVIETVAIHRVRVSLTGGIHLMGRCDNAHAQGCYNPEANRIDMAYSSAEDMAVRLVHEATHVRYAFPDEADGSQSRTEEALAWDTAMRLYGRIRKTHGNSTFYEQHYQNHCASSNWGALGCVGGP